MRVGVFICHCGNNIAGTVDVARVAEEIRKIPGVAYATTYMYTCSEPGQNEIKEAKKLEALMVQMATWGQLHRERLQQ